MRIFPVVVKRVTELIAGAVVNFLYREPRNLLDRMVNTLRLYDHLARASRDLWRLTLGDQAVLGDAFRLGGSTKILTATDYTGLSGSYSTRGGGLTGVTDGKVLLISLRVKPKAIGPANVTLFGKFSSVGGTSGRIRLTITAAGAVTIFLATSAGATICNRTTTEILLLNQWNHILVAVDTGLATAANRLGVAVNDVPSGMTGSVPTGDTVSIADGDWSVGANAAGAQLATVCVSELWVGIGRWLDVTVEADRRKFIAADLSSAELGADGSLPFGAAPEIYAPSGNPATNLGTGGNFLPNSLSACEDAPVGPGVNNSFRIKDNAPALTDKGVFTINLYAVPRTGTPDNNDWADAWVDGLLANQGVNHGNEDPLRVANLAGSTEQRALIAVDLTRYTGLVAAGGGHSFKFRANAISAVSSSQANLAFSAGVSRPFTESTVNWSNQPAPAPLFTKGATIAVNAGFPVYTISLSDAEMNQLLGKWALVRLTTPSLDAGYNVLSRENAAAIPSRNSIAFTAEV